MLWRGGSSFSPSNNNQPISSNRLLLLLFFSPALISAEVTSHTLPLNAPIHRLSPLPQFPHSTECLTNFLPPQPPRLLPASYHTRPTPLFTQFHSMMVPWQLRLLPSASPAPPLLMSKMSRPPTKSRGGCF